MADGYMFNREPRLAEHRRQICSDTDQSDNLFDRFGVNNSTDSPSSDLDELVRHERDVGSGEDDIMYSGESDSELSEADVYEEASSSSSEFDMDEDDIILQYLNEMNGELDNNAKESQPTSQRSPPPSLRRHPSYLHYRHETPRQVSHPPEDAGENMEPPQIVEHNQHLANELMVTPGDTQHQMFIDAIQYAVFPVAIYALPLAILILCLMFIIHQLTEEPEDYQKSLILLWVATILSFATSAWAICHLVKRADFRPYSKSLVKQRIQLLTIVFSGLLLTLGILYGQHNPINGSAFRFLLKEPLSITWRSWILMSINSFILSYSVLSTMEIPLALLRMANTSPVFCHILGFELVAIVLPALYIALPFVIIDIICLVIVTGGQQFLWVLVPLHLIAILWICLIITGIIKYPEIDIQRRHGALGEQFMEFVFSLQLLLHGHVFKVYLCTVHILWVRFIRSNFERKGQIQEALPEWKLQPILYFRQMIENIPSSERRYQCPYAVTVEFWLLILFVVINLRSVNILCAKWSLISQN